MNILGVRIDNFSEKQILEKIEQFLDEEQSCLPAGRFHQIATINPEFILKAQNDQEFKNILNSCELNVADGVGIRYAFLAKGYLLSCRFAGVDLMHKILELANKRELTVFLAMHPKGLSSFEDVKEKIKEKYPQIKVLGGEIDPKKSKKWPRIENAQIVFCNFGFPQQEKFLNRVKNDTIHLAMGVGGSFDFLTGKLKRAPKWMRKIGLEWLWRLIQEPRYRIKRVLNAAIIFPIRIVLNK